MTHNAAIMATLKAYYPADYAAMVTLCKENRYDPEEEIPAFIETAQIKEAQVIKAAVRKETPAAPEDTPRIVQENTLSGFNKMAEYARNTA